TGSSSVAFTWSAVTDALSYRLFVAPGNDAFSFYGETTDTTLSRFVPAGNVKWFVTAQFAACPQTTSPTSSFTVADRSCLPASITLASPAEGATTSSPVHVSWTGNGIAAGESYRVWVALGNDAPVIIAKTTSTEASLSLPAGDFTWHVDVP